MRQPASKAEAGEFSPRRLEDKVAIVTGAGTSASEQVGVGVGRAIAIAFARAGAAGVIVDRDPTAAASTATAIKAESLACVAVAADVSSAEDCERAVLSAIGAFGGVDIAVNSAAIVALGGAADLNLAEWDRVIATNLTGAMLMTRYAIPALVARGGGSVVNISSVAAARGHGLAAYAASKAGLEALTIDTAYSYGANGVRANTIAVGSIDGPMSRRAGINERADRLRHAANLLGSAGSGWDVALAALFLASEESRWITGVTLPVDGGSLTTLATTMYDRLRVASGDGAPR